MGGADKSSIRVRGRTCLERLLDLRPLFEDVYAVGGPLSDLRTVPDQIHAGAPGGVHAALLASRSPWIVAVGCDMPFVTSAVVERLLRECEDAVDAVCFEVSGRLEPLLGAYRKQAAERWALYEQPSFRQLFRSLSARVLPESELRQVDPDARSIISLNTPEDVARWAPLD